MKNQVFVNWGGHNIQLTWLPKNRMDDSSKITSVHGYCFDNDSILLVNVEGRGFTIPGGHVEIGETPEEAFHREAYEEGYVKGIIHYLGAIEVSHEFNPLFNPNGKYPLIGYQLFYRMDVKESFPFLSENETTSRIWVNPEEIPHKMNDHEISLLIMEEALNLHLNKF